MTAGVRRRSPEVAVLLTAAATAWVALAAGLLPHTHGSTAHTPSIGVIAAFAAGWVVMSVAMMAPTLIGPVRYVREHSLARRRGRAVTLFVAGHGAVWLVAGVVAQAVVLSPVPPFVAAVIASSALLWQLSPAKGRCLNRLHAHPPLAAFGATADRDAVRFGAGHGGWCALSCGPLMLVPFLLPDGHLAVMAAVAVWLTAERLDPPGPPRWRVRGMAAAARLIAARTRAKRGPHHSPFISHDDTIEG